MTNEEIIEQIIDNKWWPFDRVDPKILEEVMRRAKKQSMEDIGDAPL